MRRFSLDLHGEKSAGSPWALAPQLPCGAALCICEPRGRQGHRSKWWASLPRRQGEGSAAQVRTPSPAVHKASIAWGWVKAASRRPAGSRAESGKL